MGEKLKSAFELAMERLKAREADGESSAPSLSEEQKERIAAIRAEFRSKRSEREFLHRSAVAEATAAENHETLARLEDDFARERAQLEAEEERAVREVRGE